MSNIKQPMSKLAEGHSEMEFISFTSGQSEAGLGPIWDKGHCWFLFKVKREGEKL